MNEPLVSIVIPVHDRAEMVVDAIESARNQTHRPVEVIVVDDGSSDATPDVLAGFGDAIRSVRLEGPQGPSAARNAGIALASGEYVTFLDADDVMVPERVAVQLAHLRASGAGAVLVKQHVEVLPGVSPPPWLRDNPDHLHDGGHLPISLLLRTDVLRAAGGFDATYAMSEDMELLFRLSRAGVRVDKIDDVLVTRRIHGDNLTYRDVEMRRDLVRAVRANMRRGDG